MASVVKYYCDRQSCERELPKSGVVSVAINFKRKPVYPEMGDREININLDLCSDCAEKLREYLEDFFNSGSVMYEQMGEGPIKMNWIY